MIDWRYLLRLHGYACLGMGLFQLISTLWAIAEFDKGIKPLLESASIASLFGGLIIVATRRRQHELNYREALLYVATVWFFVGVIGALPFWLSGQFPTFTDALFESISGFTTTGASVLSNVESLPDSIQFWRGLTHWIGGLGIVVLMVAILPLVGAGGMALYRAEFSGASSEKLRPRIAGTASSLYKLYVAFTLIGVISLLLAGMRPLDACFHTFAALGTGGFSTRNASVKAFDSVAIEVILIVLMIAGGLNFTQHYRLIIERRVTDFARDSETRFYFGALLTSTILIAFSLFVSSGLSASESIREASFQCVSIMTATGFSTADFTLWSQFAQFVLLTLMWIGGSTGSTAGGIKCARIRVFLNSVNHTLTVLDRHHVKSFTIAGKPASASAVQSVLKLVLIAIIFNFSCSLLLTIAGVDILTSISAVTATMFNVGPGLGTVGPAANYGHLSLFPKWVLIFAMIAGRLEFFNFLVIFTKYFWQK